MKNSVLKISCVLFIIFLLTGNCLGDDIIRQWIRIWGSTDYDYGCGVSVDSFGNAYVAGYTGGEFDGQTNVGNSDICLTKYNSSGEKQ